jgi:hypothetical protein
MQSTPMRERPPTAGEPVSAAPNDGASISDSQRDMDEADVVNGESSPANDTEARYGKDESPA